MSVVSGKVALVTGGASGLGICFAKELLRNGLKGVTLADINPEYGRNALKEIEEEFGEGRAIFVKTDVSNKQQVEESFKRTVDEYKQLDIVINNAGIFNDKEWEKEISINCNGTVYGTLLAVEDYLPKFKSGKEGVVVNVSSMAGVHGWGAVPVYCATKHFGVGFSTSMGSNEHYTRTKVRVVVICVGATETPILNFSGKGLGPDYESIYEETIIKAHIQKPEHVAKELITVLEASKSGTAWSIEKSKPAYEIDLSYRVQHSK